MERKNLEMIAAMIIVMMVITLTVKIQAGAMKDLNQVSTSTLSRLGYKSAVSFHVINNEDSFGKLSEENYNELSPSSVNNWPEEIPRPKPTSLLSSSYIMDLASDGCSISGNGLDPNFLPIPVKVYKKDSNAPLVGKEFRWVCVGDMSSNDLESLERQQQLSEQAGGVGSP